VRHQIVAFDSICILHWQESTGRLKPTLSLRPGTLVKQLQLNEKFTDSVDSGTTLSVNDEAAPRNYDESETFRYYYLSI